MGQDHEIRGKKRIPEAVGGIQVNFCKNPACTNFGVPASPEKQPRGPGARDRNRDAYTLSGSKRKWLGDIFLNCHCCGESPSMKSNQAIQEELLRLSSYLQPRPAAACPNADCTNHDTPADDKQGYHAFGKTAAGSQRYRCRTCGKTFSVKQRASLRHRKPHKNLLVFQLLVNKAPFRRISEVAGISMPAIYDKLDFIHRQCLAFVSNRERRLPDLTLPRLYVAVDRQNYLVNWSDGGDKRNIILSSLGSADQKTGYVFGMHLNFDPSLIKSNVLQDADRRKDHELLAPFRRYARLWLPEDYTASLNHNGLGSLPAHGTLHRRIKATYDEALEREDVEAYDNPDVTTKLPQRGFQVHAEYTLYGHFFLLKQLFCNVEKVRFFLDQESGIRAACLAAFQQEVKEKRCDAFYVRINKNLTVNEKRRLRTECKRKLDKLKEDHPGFSDTELELLLIKERMQDLTAIGKWQDKWLYHPLPSMSEPEKAVCWLTDLNDNAYDEDHLARLYKMASLHAIDRFFMQARRRLSLIERPLTTTSNSQRRWHGYNAYRPENIIKIFDIFRVFYNYVGVGEDGQTPAMRLGLSKGGVGIEDIIYYLP
jgi:transposase-like protein